MLHEKKLATKGTQTNQLASIFVNFHQFPKSHQFQHLLVGDHHVGASNKRHICN
jgi:hypothetical protein